MLLFYVGNSYYLGFFKNWNGGRPSIILQTTLSEPVSYSVQIPGISYYRSGTITAGNDVRLSISNSVEVASRDDQNKGIYIATSSSQVTVIGQNDPNHHTSETFLALPTKKRFFKEYVYYGISVLSSNLKSTVLIVGTEDTTMMNLTVTQSVTIKVHSTVTSLIPGRQYSFVINRLQTIYIGLQQDLTGSKIVTNKPVSVFSGHECANVPQYLGDCGYIIEQVPPTTSWGRDFYIAPLGSRRAYTVKVVAAHDSTTVDIYCNNAKLLSHILNDGGSVSRILSNQQYCVIHSTKQVLVAQFGHCRESDSGDPMMTLVPAAICCLHTFNFSTIRNPITSGYRGYYHYVNIIVAAQNHQPSMIYLGSGGVNRLLTSQNWVPLQVDNVIVAYAAIVGVSEGTVQVMHSNTSALLTVVVYGFSAYNGYGHPGGLVLESGWSCMKLNCISTGMTICKKLPFNTQFLCIIWY